MRAFAKQCAVGYTVIALSDPEPYIITDLEKLHANTGDPIEYNDVLYDELVKDHAAIAETLTAYKIAVANMCGKFGHPDRVPIIALELLGPIVDGDELCPPTDEFEAIILQ